MQSIFWVVKNVTSSNVFPTRHKVDAVEGVVAIGVDLAIVAVDEDSAVVGAAVILVEDEEHP